MAETDKLTDVESADRDTGDTASVARQDSSCHCCPKCCIITLKCIFILLLVPVFLVVLAVALVLGLLILPFMCLSPCCAPCIIASEECLGDSVKQPVRLMRWISHRETEPAGDEPTHDSAGDEKTDLVTSEKDANGYGTDKHK